MDQLGDIGDRVMACLRRFLDTSGRQGEEFTTRSNLATGLGLTSDEGLDLVLDLCEEFDFDFPRDFNPVVHPSGTRGNGIHELVANVRHYLDAAKVGA